MSTRGRRRPRSVVRQVETLEARQLLSGAGVSRSTISGVDYLGEATFPTGLIFGGTQVGGLSGITYDSKAGVYHAISDDRSQFNPARFYSLTIALEDGVLASGDVAFTGVTSLLQPNGTPYPALSLDPEGIALTKDGTLFISSEGENSAARQTAPFVNEYSLAGAFDSALPVPSHFLPNGAVSGIRNNLAFESLTISPDGRYLFTATENALIQDGPAATLEDESPSRILKYDLLTGQPVAEFVYYTDAVEADPVPAGSFATNGLVELLAIDNNGTLLSVERSFSNGVGNAIKLYEVRTQGAVNVLPLDSIGGLEADPAVNKRLILDFADLGITLDNIEGLTFGPTLADGRRSIVVVSDNNFSATQFTQFLAFAIDVNVIPAALPVLETPPIIDADPEDVPTGLTPGDSDDPAIWVHPSDPAKSLVLAALKDGGLQVYDLKGKAVQTIAPNPGQDLRYNNVDVLYGFPLGNKSGPAAAKKVVDLAIYSDRENDTLAIFSIDPKSGKLKDSTGVINGGAPVFEGDGEATVYGLAAFKSPVSGKSFVFVTQREGDKVAQLELTYGPGSKISATVVRTLTLPIPEDGELEDAQSEAMVVDAELGLLYVAQENVGIWKFLAEPTASSEGVLIHPVVDDDAPDGTGLKADAEGLTIYHGANGTGYLLASSQGDSTFAVYTREGDNAYLGSFVVGPVGGIDQADETDGAAVINIPLGPDFPFGLMVVHDGANDPQVLAEDDGELENISTNLKYVPWQNVALAFPTPLVIDTTSYHPRKAPPAPSELLRGIASGDTNSTSTVLWASAGYAGDLVFEVATDSGFNQVVQTFGTQVLDPFVPVKVHVSGLTADSTYHYRATLAGTLVRKGQFNTAAVETHAGLSFGASGDWRGELAPYPSVGNADAAALDFFVALGDTIYADYPSPDLPKPQAETLQDYRVKNNEVYSERLGVNTLGDLRASTSILATIDDHEVTNDFEGGAPIGSDPRFSGDPDALINDSQLYDDGMQAFQEYNPVADEHYGDTGDPRTAFERKLYRDRTYGLDAAVFLLDARSFRDPGLPGVANPTDPAQVGAYLAASFNPARTMLGEVQIDELEAGLLTAQQQGVTWKFIVVPEPIQNLGVVGASDRFEGYAAERTRLLAYINNAGISNVVFISADIHGTLVNNLTYQTAPGTAQIPTSAFEITTGSVAFDAPFGPTVIQLGAALGAVTPAQLAFYDSLPVAGDTDSVPNDKDDFVKLLLNQQITPLGYDPVGLNANLPVATGMINATLLEGDYVATHTFGWTQFQIDAQTGKLTVTTYGIEPYTAAQLQASPGAILARQPVVVSRFEVVPGAPATVGSVQSLSISEQAATEPPAPALAEPVTVALAPLVTPTPNGQQVLALRQRKQRPAQPRTGSPIQVRYPAAGQLSRIGLRSVRRRPR